MNVNKSQKGFTLVEILAVIFVIAVGITGVFSLIQTTISSSRLISQQLTATYLAQEGVELVRAVRDTNWLEDRFEDTAWDEDLNQGEYQLDYTDLEEGETPEDPAIEPYGDYLKLDGEGYNYDTGDKTRFKRKITVEKLNSDKMKVTAEVFFNFQGAPRSVKSQEILYNWYRRED